LKLKRFKRVFNDESYFDLLDYLETCLTRLSLFDNLDGYIAENVTIAAGETAEIAHGLRTTPQFRIIVRQTGNGLVTDDPGKPFTDTFIYLKNNGVVSVTISVLIMRG
jgi:hypothetical protein